MVTERWKTAEEEQEEDNEAERKVRQRIEKSGDHTGADYRNLGYGKRHSDVNEK